MFQCIVSHFSWVWSGLCARVCVGGICWQMFIHRVFGYRGVILFPWVGKVYDRDISTKDEKYCSAIVNIKHFWSWAAALCCGGGELVFKNCVLCWVGMLIAGKFQSQESKLYFRGSHSVSNCHIVRRGRAAVSRPAGQVALTACFSVSCRILHISQCRLQPPVLSSTPSRCYRSQPVSAWTQSWSSDSSVGGRSWQRDRCLPICLIWMMPQWTAYAPHLAWCYC